MSALVFYQGRAISRSPRRLGNRRPLFATTEAFTILELLIVISVIIVLAGLILATSGYVQKKGARSRTEAEIAAISAALESYKADNGVYPRDKALTDKLQPITDTSYATNSPPDPKPTSYNPGDVRYKDAGLVLYKELSGDKDLDRAPDTGQKSYLAFRPNMLAPSGGTGTVTAMIDPFGNSYGYSTAYQGDIDAGNTPTHGFNPTFDLWSTAGTVNSQDAQYERAWIKNW